MLGRFPHQGRGQRGPERHLPLAVALLLAALNLRTAVTSVGPLLDELQAEIGLSSTYAGILTTMPVLCFAVLGWLTPRLAHHLGERRTLALGLLSMTAGLFLRALAESAVPFLLLSALALAGGALGNVLLPVLVKRNFPDRVGSMTAGYTTTLALGTTLAAALVVPIADLGDDRDWRVGLGAFAVVSAVAFLALLPLLGQDGKAQGGPRVASAWRLSVSPTARALAAFFGAQSMQAYIAFGWFAQLFRERAEASAAEAGFLVAMLAAVTVPTAMVVPWLAGRTPSQRPLLMSLLGIYAVAYSGLLLAPAAAPWLWAVLFGLGMALFPLALTMIGLRSRSADTTTALSAFVQSLGYLVAGSGPLLVGVTRGATGGWVGLYVLLFACLVVQIVSGWRAASPRYVDDELDPADVSAPRPPLPLPSLESPAARESVTPGRRRLFARPVR